MYYWFTFQNIFMKHLYKILFCFVLIFSVNQLNAKVNSSYSHNDKKILKKGYANLTSPTASITSSASSVCKGGTTPVITFTGSGGTAPYTFTYEIDGAVQPVISSGAGGAAVVNVPTSSAATFVYTLVNVAEGSSPSVTITGQSVTVIVNPLPTVDFTFANNQCSGTAIQFNTTSSGNSYTWNFGDGNTSGLQNPLHTFNSLGCGTAAFTVSLTITDSNGCSSTKMITATIKQQPNINFKDNNVTYNPLNLSNQFSNCGAASASNPNYNIIVEDISLSKSCVSSYSIKWGDSSADATNVTFPVSHSYTQLGAFQMIITAIGSNGCKSSKTYTVKNESNPSGSLSSPGSTENLCAPTPNLEFVIANWGKNSPTTIYTIDYGDNTPLLVLSQDQLNGSSYYNPSNPALSGNYPVPHSYLLTSCPNASITATLVMTNSCGSTRSTISPISILRPPVSKFTNPNNACVNSSVLFTNTSTASLNQSCIENTVYKWDFGDGTPISSITSAGKPNANHIYTSPGTYSITLTTYGYCGDPSVFTSTICIEQPLAPSFTLNTNSGCTPLSVTTNNTTPSTNICTTPTYVWNVTYTSGNCGTSISPIPNQNTTNASYNFTEAGTYTIKLTATNSCGSFNSTQTVVVKKPPTTSAINGILTNYCGPTTVNPTATITACTPSSGTLTYAWSFPGGTPSSSTAKIPVAINYTASGTHTVTLVVTNECGASTPFTKTFTINDAPTLTTTPLSQTICSGTATSAITLTSNLSGATYTWSGTATAGISGFTPSGTTNTIPSQTISSTSSSTGTITYVITPSINGCSGTPTNYVISINPGPSITSQPISSTICLGGTPTSLSVTLNNTSGGPTYQWYSNTVNNTTTGTIISGAVNPSYLPLASKVGETYYYCIITLTSGGCSSITSTIASVKVVNSASITTQPLASQNLCVGATITSALSVSYSGGTGTPTYQWFSNSTNSTTGGTAISGAINSTYLPPIFTSASSYFYYVIITLSGNSCGNLTSSIAEIIVNSDPTIATQPLSSQSVCQSTIPTNLTVILTSGSGAFSYQWYSNLVNNTTGGTSIATATNSTYTPLTTMAGTKYYYCVITQNGVTGCGVTSATSAVIINIAPSFTSQPLSSTICLGQLTPQLSVTYANGSGTAQYQWYNNTLNSTAGGTAITFSNAATFQPSSSTIGTNYYYCVITFPSLSGGCGVITSIVAQVTVNPKATISSKTSTICSGEAFTITPTNTSGDIVSTGTTYTWSNPTISPSGSVTGASAQSSAQNNISQTLINTKTSIATVTYTVTPKTGSCVGTIFTIIVTVNPSTNPNVIKTDVTCFGINNGSISTNITGGIPFSTGAPYIISWSGPNGFTSTAPIINSLKPGDYTLSITDTGGCPILNNYTISEPIDISITTDTKTNISCFGSANGSIATSVLGGAGNYSYAWVKNGIPYATTDDISNLSAGTYVLSVSDANNCGPKTASFTIIEPPVLAVSLVSQTNITCYGASTGAIAVNTIGGTIASDYNYSWSGPNGFASSNQNLNNLLAGTYNLTVTDDLGCSKILAIILTQSSEIVINVVTTPIVCYGDNNATISITLSGGIAPYQAQWSNLAVGLNQNNLAPGDYTITVIDKLGCQKVLTINIPSPPIFKMDPTITQISCFGANDGTIKLNFVGGIPTVKLVWSDNSAAGTTRNNLGPGTYTATIIDGTPCQITKSFVIIEPQVLVLAANITNALDCNNANSGAINLLVSGGTAPFSYAWSNGSVTEDLNAISAGNYLVTVTDARKCKVSGNYSIVRPSPIVVKVETVTDFNCETKVVNQSFVAKASGGIPPYQYVWSSGVVSGPNNEMMNTSQNGLIVLNALDSRSCSAAYTLEVAIPELGTPSFVSESIAFATYGLYSIEDPIQFINTATGNYSTISWDFGDGTFSIEKDPIHVYKTEGTYIVNQTVTYPFGCVYVRTVTLKLEKGYSLIPPTAFTPNNDGTNDYFTPVFLGLSDIHFDVYDTWGSLIYSESGENIRGWDGKINNKDGENGNYYFTITAKTFYGAAIKEQGALVLIN
jgi:gliding motility-associated-like protein